MAEPARALLAGAPDYVSKAQEARERWLFHESRIKQIPPPGDWDLMLWIAGRFFGKTRCIVEHGWWEAFRIPGLRVHALAPTIGDVRRTLFEGESGFLSKMPKGLVKNYNKSLHEVTLQNDSKIFGFSATEEADRLRGPQCHLLLMDEAAAADRPRGNLETAYKVGALGCRLPYPDGTPARKIIATTPKPIPFLKTLMKRKGCIVVRGSSHENIENVSPSVMREIMSLEGTSFGRQEIYGEILDDLDQSIFKRSWFRLWPHGKKLPEFAFIVASIDTATTEFDYDIKKQESDPSCIAVFGVFNTRAAFTAAELAKYKVRSRYAALLCEFWQDHVGFPDLLEQARKLYRTKWGSPGRYPDVVLIEADKTGVALRQTLMQYNVPTWPFNPGKMSKTMRAHAASPLVLQGMLWVPESGKPHLKGQPRDWAELPVEQMCAFAGEGSVEHDEAVDVTSQALLYLMQRGTFHAEPQGRQFPDPDESEEMRLREAVRIAHKEKRGDHSPYGS